MYELYKGIFGVFRSSIFISFIQALTTPYC